MNMSASPNEKPLMIKYDRREPVPAFFFGSSPTLCEDVTSLSSGLVPQVKDNDNGLSEGGGCP